MWPEELLRAIKIVVIITNDNGCFLLSSYNVTVCGIDQNASPYPVLLSFLDTRGHYIPSPLVVRKAMWWPFVTETKAEALSVTLKHVRASLPVQCSLPRFTSKHGNCVLRLGNHKMEAAWIPGSLIAEGPWQTTSEFILLYYFYY